MQNARLNIRGFLAMMVVIVLFGLTSAEALSQSKPSETPTDEQELMKSRKANEDAQAAYYRELTKKLNEPSPTPLLIPRKTFGETVAENPASVIGIVGTILAALFAALVALTTLFVNRASAIRALLDTQFYEALKRFGDKDSATIRSSAAGLLAQMAYTERPYLPFRRARYFTTALDQLLTGLLLEESLVALKSIGAAIKQLISKDPKTIADKLYDANLLIQEDLGSLLAELFVINGCEAAPDPKDDTHANWGHWEQAHSLTGYDQWVLRDFVFKNNSFKTRFKNYLQTLKAKQDEDIGVALATLQNNLRITSNRLQINVDLYSTALGQCKWDKGEHHTLDHSFLVGGNLALQSADLRFVDLSFSQLTGRWLFKANMDNAVFIETDLKGGSLHRGTLRDGWLTRAELDNAGLEDMDLTNTKLAHAQINDFTTLKGSNWWKADFYLPVGGDVDAPLLEKLFEKYGNEVPKDPNEFHASVRNFIETKGSSATTKACA